MSKKNKKDKQVSQLRSEIEFLRAQLKSGGQSRNQVVEAKMNNFPVPSRVSPTVASGTAIPIEVTTAYLKGDLVKTFVLTGISFGLVFGLYFTEPQWPTIYQAVSSNLQKVNLTNLKLR